MTVWQPRLLRRGEEPALLELLLGAFGTWPHVETSADPMAHLLWKLDAGEEPYRAVVVDDGESIVGGILLSLRPILSKGRMILGRSGWDAAVLPSHQGEGVLSAMPAFLDNMNLGTVDVSYGYRTGHVAARKAFAPQKRGVFANYPNVLAAPTRSAPIDRVAHEPWDVRVVSEFDERIDDLWQEAAPQFDFILARTRDFLNWRYCDQRGGNFSVVLAEQDGRILGYAVERCSHGRGYIADLLALPGRLDVVSSLVQTALAALRSAGIDEAECWLASRHAYFDTLAGLGFTTIKTTKDFTYLPVRTPEAQLSYLRSPQTAVHLSAGDTDLV